MVVAAQQSSLQVIAEEQCAGYMYNIMLNASFCFQGGFMFEYPCVQQSNKQHATIQQRETPRPPGNATTTTAATTTTTTTTAATTKTAAATASTDNRHHEAPARHTICGS